VGDRERFFTRSGVSEFARALVEAPASRRSRRKKGAFFENMPLFFVLWAFAVFARMLGGGSNSWLMTKRHLGSVKANPLFAVKIAKREI
jgi:hypothetical protein